MKHVPFAQVVKKAWQTEAPDVWGKGSGQHLLLSVSAKGVEKWRIRD